MFGLEKIKGEKVDLVAEDKVKNKFFLSTVNKEKIKIYESWIFQDNLINDGPIWKITQNNLDILKEELQKYLNN